MSLNVYSDLSCFLKFTFPSSFYELHQNVPYFFYVSVICLFTVERRSAAIRGMRDVEIDHLLTGLRLLRSYFRQEQLQTPVLQFFEENLPNLSVVRNGKDGQYEVQWKDKDGNLSMNQVDGRNIHSSLLHRMSIAYPNCSAIPSFSGFDSSKDGMNNFINVSLV